MTRNETVIFRVTKSETEMIEKMATGIGKSKRD